ncbi:MAG: hypothetical protein QXJ21_02075 [Thermofilum sp.]
MESLKGLRTGREAEEPDEKRREARRLAARNAYRAMSGSRGPARITS